MGRTFRHRSEPDSHGPAGWRAHHQIPFSERVQKSLCLGLQNTFFNRGCWSVSSCMGISRACQYYMAWMAFLGAFSIFHDKARASGSFKRCGESGSPPKSGVYNSAHNLSHLFHTRSHNECLDEPFNNTNDAGVNFLNILGSVYNHRIPFAKVDISYSLQEINGLKIIHFPAS